MSGVHRCVWMGAMLLASTVVAQPEYGVRLTTMFFQGQEIPSLGTVSECLSIDTNFAGDLATRVRFRAFGSTEDREALLIRSGSGEIRVVAEGGREIPGTGRTPEEFTSFCIDDAGSWIFRGSSRLRRQEWVFLSESPAQFHEVLYESGTMIPETNPARYLSTTFPINLTPDGAYSLQFNVADRAGGDPIGVGILHGTGGTLSLVLPDSTIGELGLTSLRLFRPLSIPSGQSATFSFQAQGVRQGTWRRMILKLFPPRLVAESGMPAPGLSGVTFESFPEYSYAMRDGRVVFPATLAGRGVDAISRSSLWIDDGTLVARGRQAAPGQGDGVIFVNFGLPVPFGDGGLLYTCLFGDGRSWINSGVCAGPVGSPSIIVRTGDQIEGCPEGTLVGRFDTTDRGLPIHVNATGTVVFPTARGLVGAKAGFAPFKIARPGDVCEVAGRQRTFQTVSLPFQDPQYGPSVESTSGGRRVVINDREEAFFLATLAGGGNALVRATLRFGPCRVDFNRDGFLDLFDYAEFVGAFEVGLAGADLSGDGFIDFMDYDLFIAGFEAGC
jgi:hypothetical protein